MIDNDRTRVIDASTAHRTDLAWTFGLPELVGRDVVAASKRVSNPGCYSTGFIALVAPLVKAGLLPSDWPYVCNAVSGYSGGGKSMIAAYDARTAPDFELYGLGLEHKHVAEMQKYSGLTRRPIFVPSVADYAQGMIDSIPLHLDMLKGGVTPADLEALLMKRYAGSDVVRVVTAEANGKLEPEALNGTNGLEIRVYGNEKRGHAVLVARYDNLGKGASGAAVQNLGLMLGVPVSADLPKAA
jgi:N-acetyl-gamma-glutamyl-phosphate reductase